MRVLLGAFVGFVVACLVAVGLYTLVWTLRGPDCDAAGECSTLNVNAEIVAFAVLGGLAGLLIGVAIARGLAD
jgi:hypothetical protein